MVKQMLLVEVSLDSDGATVITCRGEADFHTVGELSEAIAWSIESQPAPRTQHSTQAIRHPSCRSVVCA